jgi:hypothetical protein
MQLFWLAFVQLPFNPFELQNVYNLLCVTMCNPLLLALVTSFQYSPSSLSSTRRVRGHQVLPGRQATDFSREHFGYRETQSDKTIGSITQHCTHAAAAKDGYPDMSCLESHPRRLNHEPQAIWNWMT